MNSSRHHLTTKQKAKHRPHSNQHMNDLAAAVGDFIRYWGFRRIHGQIWTWLYLSPQPLSGAELVKLLKVSKALVSPALHELVDYKLIEVVPDASDYKTQKFSAQPKVMEVIRNILRERETKLIARAQLHHNTLAEQMQSEDSPLTLNKSRLENLGNMIQMAAISVEFLTQMEGFEV